MLGPRVINAILEVYTSVAFAVYCIFFCSGSSVHNITAVKDVQFKDLLETFMWCQL